jgi:hypothetical protein
MEENRMAEIIITDQKGSMESAFKKKGMMGTPEISTEEMEKLKEYLPYVKKFLKCFEGAIDSTDDSAIDTEETDVEEKETL